MGKSPNQEVSSSVEFAASVKKHNDKYDDDSDEEDEDDDEEEEEHKKEEEELDPFAALIQKRASSYNSFLNWGDDKTIPGFGSFAETSTGVHSYDEKKTTKDDEDDDAPPKSTQSWSAF